MAHSVTSAQALETCASYLEELEYEFTLESDAINVQLLLGLFGAHYVRIQARKSSICAASILCERLPPGFESTALELWRMSEGRLRLTEDCQLVWGAYFEPEELNSFERVDALLYWISREAFIAESVIDLYAMSGREPVRGSLAGFGPDSEFDMLN